MAGLFKHLVISAILALLVCLSGCTSFPPGVTLALGVTGSPLGISLTVARAPELAPGLPDSGFVVGPPAPAPAPATAPATRPTP